MAQNGEFKPYKNISSPIKIDRPLSALVSFWQIKAGTLAYLELKQADSEVVPRSSLVEAEVEVLGWGWVWGWGWVKLSHIKLSLCWQEKNKNMGKTGIHGSPPCILAFLFFARYKKSKKKGGLLEIWRLKLISTQIVVEVEVGVELGTMSHRIV